MEVMVIYVWQCMVVLLYDCICAGWLWSIMNEHATATINYKIYSHWKQYSSVKETQKHERVT